MLDSEIPPRGQDSRFKNSTSGPRLTVYDYCESCPLSGISLS